MEPLLNLLRSGMYTMRGEREELETRAHQKKTGAVPRNKVSAQRFNQQASSQKSAEKSMNRPEADLKFLCPTSNLWSGKAMVTDEPSRNNVLCKHFFFTDPSGKSDIPTGGW